MKNGLEILVDGRLSILDVSLSGQIARSWRIPPLLFFFSVISVAVISTTCKCGFALFPFFFWWRRRLFFLSVPSHSLGDYEWIDTGAKELFILTLQGTHQNVPTSEYTFIGFSPSAQQIIVNSNVLWPSFCIPALIPHRSISLQTIKRCRAVLAIKG